MSGDSKNPCLEQPSSTLLSGNATPRADVLRRIEITANLVTNITKIAAFASFPIGFLLLNSYLRDEGAPMPSADASISVLLSLVCIVFLFIASESAMVLLLPAIARIPDNLFSVQPSRASAQKDHWWRKVSNNATDYVLFFGFYFSLIPTLLGVYLANERGWHLENIRLIALVFLLISLAVVFLSWRHGHRTVGASCPKLIELSFCTVFSLFSSFVLFLFLDVVTQQVDKNMAAWMTALICVGVPLATQMITVLIVKDWRTFALIFVGLFIIFSCVWPKLPFMGGSSLRFIGLGGGIPVSIAVKPTVISDNFSTLTEISGCLILMTSSDLIIRPTYKESDCGSRPPMLGQAPITVPPYSRVIRLQRADVVRVSKFPESCGTVDGLPSC